MNNFIQSWKKRIYDQEIKGGDFLLIIFIILGFLSIRYQPLGLNNNQKHQLTFLYRMIDPNYLKNDWYVNITQNNNIREIFHHLMVLVNKLFNNFEIAYFVIFAIIVFIYSIYIFKLSSLLFKNKNISFLAIIFILFGGGFALAGHALLGSSLLAISMATFLIPAIFYYLFKNNLILTSILLGIATLFHLEVGVQLFVIIFLFLIFRRSLFSKRKIISLIQFVFSYLLVSAYVVIPYFFSSIEDTTYSSQLIINILRLRAPWHFFPFSWHSINHILFFLFFIFSIYELYYFYKQNKDLGLKIIRLFSVVFIFFVIGIIFTELLPVRYLILAELFRMSGYVLLFNYLLVIRHIFRNYQKSNLLQKIFYFILIFSFLPFSLKFFPYLFIVLVSIYFVHIFILEKFKKNIFDIFYNYISKTNKLKLFLVLFVAIILGLLIFVMVTGNSKILILTLLENSYNFIRKNVIYENWMSLIFISAMSLILFKNKTINFGKFSIIGLIILFSIAIPLTKVEKEKKIYSYIKQNTPKDSIFLAPPCEDFFDYNFRYNAQRAILVDFKNFSAMQEIMVEWYDRILDISGYDYNSQDLTLKKIIIGYNQLTIKDIQELKRKYKINYAIFKENKQLNLPAIYRDNKFVIYKID